MAWGVLDENKSKRQLPDRSVHLGTTGWVFPKNKHAIMYAIVPWGYKKTYLVSGQATEASNKRVRLPFFPGVVGFLP